ncbi:hypothetical protein B0H14DRAFT_3440304 [Mycena olivaceomarginata]|nr:hypothetical protein B0H14DRAFT_3440304 [Mycena olivaceomarginata]
MSGPSRDRHRPSRPTDGTKDGRPVDRPSTVRWDSVSHGARRDGTVDGTAVDGGRTVSQQRANLIITINPSISTAACVAVDTTTLMDAHIGRAAA